MHSFSAYFGLGFNHILWPLAYDHVLFVASLCLLFVPNKLKPLFWLITAFTIGHSITLFLVGLKILHAPINFIEFLIPITIALSAAFNLFAINKRQKPKLKLQYTITAIFGMVHGIAFATETFGLEGVTGLAIKVLAFNIGIEIAQICIVFLVWFFTYIFVQKFKVKINIWVQLCSGIIILYATYLAIENFKNL